MDQYGVFNVVAWPKVPRLAPLLVRPGIKYFSKFAIIEDPPDEQPRRAILIDWPKGRGGDARVLVKLEENGQQIALHPVACALA
jgi:hypothetical protein